MWEVGLHFDIMTSPEGSQNKEIDCLSPEAQRLAEARLAAKRAARAEAREIRMKELERQQKEVMGAERSEVGSFSVRTVKTGYLLLLSTCSCPCHLSVAPAWHVCAPCSSCSRLAPRVHVALMLGMAAQWVAYRSLRDARSLRACPLVVVSRTTF